MYMPKKLTTYDFINKANKIHHNVYDYSLVDYVNTNTKVKIICNIHGVFEQRPCSHIKQKHGCPYCAKNKKLSTEVFIREAKKIHKNKYDYSLSEYVDCCSTKIKIICPNHGIFEQRSCDHLLKKCGCPHCSNNQKLTTNIFIDRANKIHNNKFDYSLVDYVNSHKKVFIICPNHGIFEQKPYSHLQGFGCKMCNVSKGELRIKKILEEEKIKYIQQHSFPDCKNKFPLKFDFYLPKLNVCIEYDGYQHFQPHWGDHSGKNFIKTKERDEIKNKYCTENNIKLIRITDTNINNELWLDQLRKK